MRKFIHDIVDRYLADIERKRGPSGRLPELINKETGLTESQTRVLNTRPPAPRVGVALEDIKKGQMVTMDLTSAGIYHVRPYDHD